MNAKQHARTPSPRTGFLATLRSLPGAKGSGAPSSGRVHALLGPCLVAALLLICILAPAAQADFGFQPGSASVQLFNRDNTVDEQASSHPYSLVLQAALKTDAGGFTEGGQMRDLAIDLPPGLIGNPLAVPRCPRQSFEGGNPHCPAETQVGVLRAVLPGIGEANGPLFNLSPPPGVPAQVGFSTANLLVLGSARLRSEEGYGVRVLSPSLPVETSAFTATIWGVPADPHHDPERFCTGTRNQGCETGASELPFLTLPASSPNRSPSASKPTPPSPPAPSPPRPPTPATPPTTSPPSAAATPSPSRPKSPRSRPASWPPTPRAWTSASKLPNQGLLNPGGIAETEPKKVVVTLPEGVTLNPSLAEGLGVCTEAELKAEDLESEPGAGCPDESKIGIGRSRNAR